ncbi:MAG: hypothetical protein Kow0020_04920 [Wenzhouxiangellaceae bacterium]
MHLNASTAPRGYTLIELMLALAVASLVVVLALPAMGSFLARQRIDAAANELVAHLNVARLAAVSRAHRVVLCPSTDGAQCDQANRWERGWIVFHDPDGNLAPASDADLIRIHGPVDGMDLDSAGRRFVRYQPDGTAGGSNLTIKLCDRTDPERARAVIVSNTGRPRVADLPAHLQCPG